MTLSRQSRFTNTLATVCILTPLIVLGCSVETATSTSTETAQAPVTTPASDASTTPTDSRTPATTPTATAGDPTIAFETKNHDWGEIYDVETVYCEFPFKNTGTETLVISEVKAGCGCTATELEKKVFAPGEGEAIKVEFKPKGKGRQSKTIDVMSNSKGDPVVRLMISATITPFVKLDPMYARFGPVKINESHTQRITVNCLDPDMQFTKVVAGSPFVTAVVMPGDEVPGRDGAHSYLDVTITDEAPWGRFQSTVLVTATGRVTPDTEPVEHQINIPVSASIFGNVQAEPDFFMVGAVEPRGEVDRVITLTNATGEPFNVTRAEVTRCNVEGLSVRVEPSKDGKGLDLVLNGPVNDHLGIMRGSVEVETDVPGEQMMTFSLMGMVRELTEKDARAEKMKRERELREQQGK